MADTSWVITDRQRVLYARALSLGAGTFTLSSEVGSRAFCEAKEKVVTQHSPQMPMADTSWVITDRQRVLQARAQALGADTFTLSSEVGARTFCETKEKVVTQHSPGTSHHTFSFISVYSDMLYVQMIRETLSHSPCLWFKTQSMRPTRKHEGNDINMHLNPIYVIKIRC